MKIILLLLAIVRSWLDGNHLFQSDLYPTGLRTRMLMRCCTPIRYSGRYYRHRPYYTGCSRGYPHRMYHPRSDDMLTRARNNRCRYPNYDRRNYRLNMNRQGIGRGRILAAIREAEVSRKMMEIRKSNLPDKKAAQEHLYTKKSTVESLSGKKSGEVNLADKKSDREMKSVEPLLKIQL